MQQLLKYGVVVALVLGLALVGSTSVQTSPLRRDQGLAVLDREIQPSRNFLVRVPEDYSTIQAAIDAATEGATILIGPGLYKENVQITKSLRLVGVGQEQVQIQAADDSKPVIHVFSRTPIQNYFQGLTLGDPTLSLEQVLQLPPPPGPISPNYLPYTGLFVAGPIQTLVRQVTVGGLGVGICISGILPDILFEFQPPAILPDILFEFQPPAILEEVRLVHNAVGLLLWSAQGFILRSVIEENFGGIWSNDGTVFLYHSVVRGNQQFGVNLNAYEDPRLIGHIYDNEIAGNGIGVYLVAWRIAAGSWIDISSNRIVQSEQYAVVVQDPACPFLPHGLPVPPGEKSAPIQIRGSANELQWNRKGDLCPEDYPWPPGFRK